MPAYEALFRIRQREEGKNKEKRASTVVVVLFLL